LLPVVATQWNVARPGIQSSNPGHRARIPSALTTRPLRNKGYALYSGTMRTLYFLHFKILCMDFSFLCASVIVYSWRTSNKDK